MCHHYCHSLHGGVIKGLCVLFMAALLIHYWWVLVIALAVATVVELAKQLMVRWWQRPSVAVPTSPPQTTGPIPQARYSNRR